MLKARESLPVTLVSRLRRWIRREDPAIRLDLESFVDFMVHGRNLKRDGVALSFYHPRVEDGLRMALESRAGIAEDVLSRLVDALIASDGINDDWGVETALRVLKEAGRLANVTLNLSAEAQVRLETFVEVKTRDAGRRDEFSSAMHDMARFGSASHAPSVVARLLLGTTSTGTSNQGFGRRWRLPHVDLSQIAALQAYPGTSALTKRFVSDLLPISDVDYGAELVSFVRLIEPDTTPSFNGALESMMSLGGVCNSCEAIVTGACDDEPPNFEGVIESIAAASDEVDAWMTASAEERRKAKEHEIDAGWADHIVEQPSERYYNSREAMQVVAGLRRAREGTGWVASHPRKGLLVEALIDAAEHSREHLTVEYLRTLIGLAEDWNKVRVWRLAAKHRFGLDDLVANELCVTGLEHSEQRQLLLQVLAASAAEEGFDAITRIPIDEIDPLRRIELVFDAMQTRHTLDHEPIEASSRMDWCAKLAAHFTSGEASLALALAHLLNGEPAGGSLTELSPDAVGVLQSIFPLSRPDLAAPLVFLGTAAGLDCLDEARRVMKADEAESAMNAALAMTMRSDEQAVDFVRECLVHPHYKVRRLAMNSLLERQLPADRSLVLTMAKDASADVRLEWANAMCKRRWVEAIEPLAALVGDSRNYDSRPQYLAGPSWSDFAVARAAARSLGAYDTLPDAAVDRLLLAVGDRSCTDPLVACRALTALTFCDDARIDGSIMAAFRAPPIASAPGYRPLSQSAAWALLDRAALGLVDLDALDSDELLRLCHSSKAPIAGPLIAAVAFLDESLARTLAKALDTQRKVDRLELLLVACVVAGRPSPTQTTGPIAILRAMETQGGDSLDPGSRATIEAWGAKLDTRNGVESITAFLASEVFSVPAKGPNRDPRQYDLPKRIGFLTMRSLSGDAEERDSDGDE